MQVAWLFSCLAICLVQRGFDDADIDCLASRFVASGAIASCELEC